MQPGDFDVTGMLLALDELRLNLLQSVVDLQRSMSKRSTNHDERLSALTQALINTYMLAARLGIGPVELDKSSEDAIRSCLSKEHEVLSADYATLLRHLRRRQP